VGKAACISALLALSVAASASPRFGYEETYLDGGHLAYDVYVYDDVPLEPFSVSVVFTGHLGGAMVQQHGDLINSETWARAYGVLDTDTYAMTPLGDNPIWGQSVRTGETFYGFREGEDWWEMSCDMGGAVPTGNRLNIAHVVTPGEWLHLAGTITMDSVVYEDASYEPFIEVNGPYTIEAGQPLQLNGYYGPYPYEMKWDLDADLHGGAADYETGPWWPSDSGLLSYEYLQSLGLEAGNTYNIHFAGRDDLWGWQYDTTMLTIVPEPATLGMLALGAAGLVRRRR
jgi:hypothetical protein